MTLPGRIASRLNSIAQTIKAVDLRLNGRSWLCRNLKPGASGGRDAKSNRDRRIKSGAYWNALIAQGVYAFAYTVILYAKAYIMIVMAEHSNNGADAGWGAPLNCYGMPGPSQRVPEI
jgi:hypothetical protein